VGEHGVDIVVEGETVRRTDREALWPISEVFHRKYPDVVEHEVDDDGTVRSSEGGEAVLLRVALAKALGFGRVEDGFSQTSWRFGDG